jgi:hypothetical protein
MTVEHSKDCKGGGFRYVSTIRSTKATRENGTAGRVVMICKGCSARKLV